jgi:SAM-dependent methyltransferase
MQSSVLSRLLAPVSAAVARQLSRPSGWFGRTVTTRVLNRGNRELIEATLDALPLSPSTRLLDVGFGGGALLALAGLRGVRSLAGVDPSEAAIRSVREHPPRGLAGATLRLEQGTAEALPFPEGAFDAVASTNTVYFWPDPAAVLAELRRVLAPSGRLALGFSGGAKMRSFDAITRHGFHLHENDRLLACAARAGFADARILDLHGRRTEGDHLLLSTR